MTHETDAAADPSRLETTLEKPSLRSLGFAGWLATGAWVGLVPFAPGTFGALWGVPLAIAINHIPSWYLQLLVIGILFLVGVPISHIAAKRIGKKDPGAVVWDEIATVPLTFFLVPVALMWQPAVLIAGFALHRLFDISKVPPAKQLEALPDGWGIMTDDLVAGIYSCVCLHALLWLQVL